MKVKFYNSGRECTEEFPDDTTEEQVADAYMTWLFNDPDVGWEYQEEEE